MVHSLLHCATCMNEGVDVHVQGGKRFACKVGKRITELVMMSHDEAALLEI